MIYAVDKHGNREFLTIGQYCRLHTYTADQLFFTFDERLAAAVSAARKARS